MTVLATDAFNRADGALGANWTTVTGQDPLVIVSNEATYTSVGNDAASVYTGVAFPDDHYSQGVVKNLNAVAPGDTGIGLIVRALTAARTNYRLTINSNPAGSWQLAKFIAGAFTDLNDGTDAWASGDTARLEAQGTTIRVLRNGVQIFSVVDGGIPTGGGAGIVYSSTATGETIDDFEGGDFVTPPTGVPLAWIRA